MESRAARRQGTTASEPGALASKSPCTQANMQPCRPAGLDLDSKAAWDSGKRIAGNPAMQ